MALDSSSTRIYQVQDLKVTLENLENNSAPIGYSRGYEGSINEASRKKLAIEWEKLSSEEQARLRAVRAKKGYFVTI